MSILIRLEKRDKRLVQVYNNSRSTENDYQLNAHAKALVLLQIKVVHTSMFVLSSILLFIIKLLFQASETDFRTVFKRYGSERL